MAFNHSYCDIWCYYIFTSLFSSPLLITTYIYYFMGPSVSCVFGKLESDPLSLGPPMRLGSRRNNKCLSIDEMQHFDFGSFVSLFFKSICQSQEFGGGKSCLLYINPFWGINMNSDLFGCQNNEVSSILVAWPLAWGPVCCPLLLLTLWVYKVLIRGPGNIQVTSLPLNLGQGVT